MPLFDACVIVDCFLRGPFFHFHALRVHVCAFFPFRFFFSIYPIRHDRRRARVLNRRKIHNGYFFSFPTRSRFDRLLSVAATVSFSTGKKPFLVHVFTRIYHIYYYFFPPPVLFAHFFRPSRVRFFFLHVLCAYVKNVLQLPAFLVQ